MAFDGFVKLKDIGPALRHGDHRAMPGRQPKDQVHGDQAERLPAQFHRPERRRRLPSETIHLNCSKILGTYTQQSRQGGSTMGNVAAGWDRRKNCAA